MVPPLKIALVGIGKIARDRHVPAIASSVNWELVATVSQNGKVDGIPAYPDLGALLTAHPDVDVISLCIPPGPRFAFAETALSAGRHVMLEKPPGATLAEVDALNDLALARGVTLFATWHSRYAHAVAAAKAWLSDKRTDRVDVTWHEDVRHWHPGQDWIFRPGGMGVFDTGINALSILTEILPIPFHVTAATLEFPENCETPIAAHIDFSNNMHVEMDWRKVGDPVWDILVNTDGGRLGLRFGGNILEINGARMEGDLSLSGEYPALYDRMAGLVRAGKSDVDLRPMTHVADTLSLGKRVVIPRFHL